MKQAFLPFLGYRLHIPILTFLIVMNELGKGGGLETILISLCFSSGIAGWYLSNKYTDWHEDSLNHAAIPVKRNGWLLASFLICYIAPVFYLYQFPLLLGLFVAALVVAGNLYNFPVGQGTKRLKNILVVKNIVAASVWSSIFAFTPALYYGDFGGERMWVSLITYFIIVLAIEIFTDIRDIDGDKQAEVATIPSVWGTLTAQVICLALIGGAMVKSLLIGSASPIFLMAYIASAFLIIFADKKRGPVYFQSMIFVWIAAEFIFLMVR